jgi:hypothetical protein
MADVKLINLTPHAVVLCQESGADVIISPQAVPARIIESNGEVVTTAHLPVPCYRVAKALHIEGLPPPADGTVYIVSRMVLEHPLAVGRPDLVAPGTDGAIRDTQGRIVAVTRLLAQCPPERIRVTKDDMVIEVQERLHLIGIDISREQILDDLIRRAFESFTPGEGALVDYWITLYPETTK